MSRRRLPLLIIRAVTGLALILPAAWLAWTQTPVPLLLLVAVAASLVSIRIGQQGEARYGRRVPVTEMFSLGRKENDRQMQLGGLAGYLMLACLGLALWAAL
ncbi:hypothetical protein [Quatrionicoccus australiensis]|uniref:hypothetical protein n=1 Tax=Quatrionicoccus australiensis TaxID=138118 RepID=UPI001CFAB6A3|nr:hypothetical protein [Quatrionicoccus australiensis]MCB4361521.1 hypothetical protein [Quatrionicoccus australiensis]